MTSTEDIQITDETLATWREERARVAEHLATIDGALTEVAAAAELGDPEAQATREDLRTERAAAVEFIENQDRAIESGTAVLARQLQAEAERRRAEARLEAERIKSLQDAEASRVDAALAELEAAVAAYREVGLLRARAERAAGMNDGRKEKLIGIELERALWASAPTVTGILQIEPRMRRHAARLRDQ